jgi:hypothetical protein
MSTERPKLMMPEDFDLETLIGLAENLASQKADGHLTVMRFTTGWKVALGTPNLDDGTGREELVRLPLHTTLREALVSLLIERNRFRI